MWLVLPLLCACGGDPSSSKGSQMGGSQGAAGDQAPSGAESGNADDGGAMAAGSGSTADDSPAGTGGVGGGGGSAGTQSGDPGGDPGAGGAGGDPGAGSGGSGGSAGSSGAGSGGVGAAGAGSSGGDCFDATLLWSEDWESGDYRNWTSETYNREWGDDCQDTAITMDNPHGGSYSSRSEITCSYPQDSVHRGYGGLQFAGDEVVPAYTNTGVGLDAPFGVVNTFWLYLDSPTVFEGGRWLGLFTVNSACDYSDRVLTLGLEDPSNRVAAAHYQAGAGGERTFEPGIPGMPRDQWVRLSVYVNYHDNEMHVWQDGASISHVTFDRAATTLCQWHWGLYASSDNDDVVLYEDDNSIWKLNERWSDFSTEPYFGHAVTACSP